MRVKVLVKTTTGSDTSNSLRIAQNMKCDAILAVIGHRNYHKAGSVQKLLKGA